MSSDPLSVVEVEGDAVDVTASEDGNGSDPKRKVRGKQFPKFQDGNKYPFLESPDPRDEELFRTLAAMGMPP